MGCVCVWISRDSLRRKWADFGIWGGCVSHDGWRLGDAMGKKTGLGGFGNKEGEDDVVWMDLGSDD